MRTTKERLLSLLLTLVMVLGLLPGTALAEEAPTLTVTFSLFAQGLPAQDREGKPMLARTVAVEDCNGDGLYSLDEALLAVHRQYAPNGQEDYASGEGNWGYSVSKLWGEETFALGFYRNHALTGTVDTETMSSGDRVTAYIYKDQENWSDRYAYFDQDRMTVPVDRELEVQLSYDSFGSVQPQPTAPIGVFDENGNYAVSDCIRGEHLFDDFYMPTVATDAQGKVKLSFTQPGVYWMTAQYDSTNYTDYNNDPPQYYLVPPLCQVTVLSAEDYAAYEDRLTLEQAADSLTWDQIRGENQSASQVTENLNIPSQLTVGERTVEVSWTCDDATGALSVSNYYGSWGAYVDRPAAQDVSCILTATLTCGGERLEKEFPITVKAEGVSQEKETVVSYGPLMTGIAGGYAASSDPWVVLAMKAYNGQNVKDGDYGYASPATLALAEAALGNPVSAEALDGVDISGPYAIYTVPYLSLAYRAGDVDNEARQSQMKETMIAYLGALETNFAGVDEVAPVLTALAPWYLEGDTETVAAVETGLNWLSAQQGRDGAFSYYGTSNANSTALAVTALSALGIDAHRDSRFIKENKSAVEGLFSFALASHTGFGYKGNVTCNALSTEQGFRALTAYARMKDCGTAYNIYLQAGESTEAVEAPAITTTRPPEESGGDETTTYRITVSVKIPPEGGAEGQYTYRDNAQAYTDLLDGSKQVWADSDTTALEVLTGILNRADISYTETNGYVSQIGGLAEGDHGPNSGWQYMVNGVAPTESAATYTFGSNASMIWYYTDDYTREKDAENWSDEVSSGSSAPSAPQVKEQGDGSYSVSLPAGQKKPTLVTISQVGEGQLVVLVDENDGETPLRKSLVENGTARLLLKKSGVVKVTRSQVEFTDVNRADWYAQGVDFVSTRGLFSGVGNGCFAPNQTLSRGMLAAVLYALEEPEQGGGNISFTDVAADHWSAAAVAWASDRGLVSGYGDGRFGLEDQVTREQLALILYHYAQDLGMNTAGRGELSRFTDGDRGAAWSAEALAWAVDAGLLSGRSDGTLDPAGAITRSEAAVMLRQFVNLMLK